jgi:hypothetical protein
MKTQRDKVVDQLRAFKKVSRNWCLQHYISRLGAIIEELNRHGWKIEGKYEKSHIGSDFVYRVIERPNNPEPIKVTLHHQILTNLTSREELNQQLKALEQTIKPSWENYQKLRNIKEAIRGKNDYQKEAVLKMYGG